MEGVRRCALDAVWKAQGAGCAPGVLGICVGGDRETGYVHSKEQFLRRLTDRSPVKMLAKIEQRIVAEANKLGIGAMGMGGKTSLLGAKIGDESIVDTLRKMAERSTRNRSSTRARCGEV